MYKIRYTATLLILICFLAASVHAAQMSVDPLGQHASNGSVITVDITVDPEELSVHSASYTLHFNNTLLYAISQETGPFLTQDGANSDVWHNYINNAAGRVEYAEARSGTAEEVSDLGALATITFEVIGEEGISTLNLSKYANELLYSPDHGGSILPDLNNGSVKVKEGICGDVDGIPGVTMNDGRQIFMNIIYGSANYPINDTWAADCDGLYDGMTMNDGRQIFMNIIYGSAQYPLECCC